MAIKLNWDRVKQLNAELEADGWKKNDKLLFILIEKGGKPKKAVVQFKELYKFCWHLMDDESLKVLTFIVQDVEGRVLYRHRQVVGNEEVPNGGNVDIISHWSALTDDEKQTYITLLVAQINAYER
jgi:hypothetical protein